MIELTAYADRMPAQLSGGQQQRVALARMLATDPQVLLFDEPLSALDRNLRDTLKYSILELQRRTKKTAIYVTHDQSEAFAISDRIFVMNLGRIEQAGTQLDIYLRPASEFVAHFVGDNNTLNGTVMSIDGVERRDPNCDRQDVQRHADRIRATRHQGRRRGPRPRSAGEYRYPAEWRRRGGTGRADRNRRPDRLRGADRATRRRCRMALRSRSRRVVTSDSSCCTRSRCESICACRMSRS